MFLSVSEVQFIGLLQQTHKFVLENEDEIASDEIWNNFDSLVSLVHNHCDWDYSDCWRWMCHVAIFKPIPEIKQPFFNTIFVSSHMYPENPEGT